MSRCLVQLIIIIVTVKLSFGVYEYRNWAFHFPAGSNMGIFIALAIPIDIPNENLFLAYNIEANYLLPGNESETVQFPPLVTDEEARSNKRITRNVIYKLIENKISAYSHPGRECLLLAICEVAISSFDHNGILGDLIHIIFTPSSSVNSRLSSAYYSAEKYGKKYGHCKKYKEKCLTSFIDIITWMEQM